jgi:hypothetical protein
MAREKEEAPLDGEINMTLSDFVVSIWEPKTAQDRLKADRILYRFVAAEQVRDGRSSPENT